MLKKSNPSILSNNKGMAIFETIPIMVVIVLFVNFSLGFFGAIHTGILNSIAARNYAFHTFRNRSNLVYFKYDNADHFEDLHARLHGSLSEKSANSSSDKWHATSRKIDFIKFDNPAAEIIGNDKSQHSRVRDLPSGRINESTHQGVNPIWIKTRYGICLDAICEN